MELGIALSVVPIIVGLVVLAIRLGLPTIYEAPTAIVLGVLISVGYTLAAQVPGGSVIADAVLRGVAAGLTTASLVATTRRLRRDGRTSGGTDRRRPRHT